MTQNLTLLIGGEAYWKRRFGHALFCGGFYGLISGYFWMSGSISWYYPIFVTKLRAVVVTKFLISYFFYSVLLAAVAILLPIVFPDTVLITSKFWVIFGFLCGLTCIASVAALLGIKRNPESGVLAILGSVTVKLLFSMAFVLIYSLNQAEKDIVFVLNFFSLYLLFTGFEIYSLLRNLRHQNLK